MRAPELGCPAKKYCDVRSSIDAMDKPMKPLSEHARPRLGNGTCRRRAENMQHPQNARSDRLRIAKSEHRREQPHDFAIG